MENGDFEIASNSSVIVEYAPVFLKGTSDGTIRRKIGHGTNFNLNCETHENPEAKAVWYFSPNPRSKIKKPTEDGNKTLRRTNMNSSLQGIYECVVENTAGASRKYFTVTDYPICNIV